MLGPVESTIYVNQQTASVASAKGNQINRLDLQNIAAQAIVNEKEEEVLEVRPTEETHEIDPEREHEKNGDDQKNKRNPKKKKEEQEEDENKFHLYKLDIKV